MADFIVGDYKYTIIPNTTNVIARVVSTEEDEYSNIPSTVSYNGTSYTVTSLGNSNNSGCFEGCTELHYSLPTIPNTVTEMDFCFCGTSLDEFPIIPNSVTSMKHCFQDCTFSSGIYPEIPEGVIDLTACFADATFDGGSFNIIFPYSVENMSYCFSGCSMQDIEILIPPNVTNLEGCFYDCSFNYSYIATLATPSNISNMLYGVQSPVYFLTTTDNGNRTFWKQALLNEQYAEIETGAVISDNEYYLIALDDNDYSASLEVIYYAVDYKECGEIPSYVLVDGDKYTVSSLEYGFNGSSIKTSPSIPSTIINMNYCFRNCSSLENTITVYNDPLYYEECFKNTYNNIYINYQGVNKYKPYMNIWKTIADKYSNVFLLESIGDFLYIPSDTILTGLGSGTGATTSQRAASVSVVDKTKDNYESILSTVDIGDNIFYVNNMESCFEDCINLKSVLYIPTYVTNLNRAFYNCKSLSGSIRVSSIPVSYTDIFTGTVKPIYIIVYDADVKTAWENITANYNNVHVVYEPVVDTFSNAVNTITFGGYEESASNNKIISYYTLYCNNEVLIAGDEELVSLIEDLNFDTNSINS